MTAQQLFDKYSDCYADTGKFESGEYVEGKVIRAITETNFIKAIGKIISLPVELPVSQARGE